MKGISSHTEIKEEGSLAKTLPRLASNFSKKKKEKLKVTKAKTCW